MLKKIDRFFIILLSRWHYLWGFCPKCNSDAPELYTCTVCKYKRIDKKLWWDRFIKELSLTETVDKSTEVGASSEVVATQKKDQTKEGKE